MTREQLSGTLAGRYRMKQQLGSGGMATVYLADDVRHHRQVALKVLRPQIAVALGADRFAREIEVAARLQHPNIVPLLDSGETDGLFFYVMPFVEGESLRERVAREHALPIPDAVHILLEVADALSHAHARGVVHRDIKPENVMLAGRHALVTDFGVAKALTAATGRQVLTSAGIALGTPAYMAPEQATADPHQDHRVDIYALGVLGYELLAGRLPYPATSAQEMLAAHLTMEPEPLERHRPDVPAALAALVMKCLRKKPGERWQTADELVEQLELLVTASAGVTPAQLPPLAAIRSMPRWLRWGAGAGALGLIAALAALAAWTKPLTIVPSGLEQITSAPGVSFQPAISPDGREIAYLAGPIGAPHLVIRAVGGLGGGEIRPTDTSFSSVLSPTWSPDGDLVRFHGCRASSCAWYEVGRLGGPVRAISLPPAAQWPAWSGGGRVAYAIADTLFTLSPAGVRRQVAIQPDGGPPHSLAWSPDQRRIAYVVGNVEWRTGGNVAPSAIWVVPADGGEPRRLTSLDHLNTGPAWLDAAHLLFVSNRDGPLGIYVVAVDARGARGAARLVAGVADAHSISFAAGSRTLVWAKMQLRQNVRGFDVRRGRPLSIGEGLPVTSGTKVIEASDVSPDGRWIAFNGDLRSRNSEIYKQLISGGEAVQLTQSSANQYGPRWSPDGRELAYQGMSAAAPGSSILIVPAEGGTPTFVTRPVAQVYSVFPAWSPDGLAIAYGLSDTTIHPWIVARDSMRGAWHEPERLSGASCYPADWAPDGGGVLCVPYPSGSSSVLTLIARSGVVMWQRDLLAMNRLMTRGFDWPMPKYSPDGSTIYIAAAHQDGRTGVWAIPAAGGPARLVVAFDDPAVTTPGHISVGRGRLYLTVSEYVSDIWAAKLDW